MSILSDNKTTVQVIVNKQEDGVWPSSKEMLLAAVQLWKERAANDIITDKEVSAETYQHIAQFLVLNCFTILDLLDDALYQNIKGGV